MATKARSASYKYVLSTCECCGVHTHKLSLRRGWCVECEDQFRTVRKALKRIISTSIPQTTS